MLSLNKQKTVDLTQGSIIKGIIAFTIPLFLGQLLQQFYNMADAWVVGNFADNDAFAAVSSSGNLSWLIVGFCNGIAVGGGVVISKFYGARDEENLTKAVHTNVLVGIIISVIATVLGLILIPWMLTLMNVPESVMPQSLTYFRIYFGGIATVVMYNIFMSIMRALGDSIHPLYYLVFSSIVNVVLDILLVAVFHFGVAGAAAATVFSQGLAAVMCLVQMSRAGDASKIELKKLRYYKGIMEPVLLQGLPTGIQNSVISIGNVVIQANINAFGAFAMSGHGAYSRLEGFAFLPTTCMAMALPTFVSQNIGAGNFKRARKGAFTGLVIGIVLAELVGFTLYFLGKPMLGFFISDEEAIRYGLIHIAIQPWFFCILAFSHCAAGVLRGLGKSVIPMFAMLSSWCIFRIIYVTAALYFIPEYAVIAWAYPITWSLTTIIFTISLLKTRWDRSYI